MHQKQLSSAHFAVFLPSTSFRNSPALLKASQLPTQLIFYKLCLGPDMDATKKVKFNWLKTALNPLTCAQEGNGGSITPPSCKTPKKEQRRSSLPLSDSPGSMCFGSLNLDTPKRKAEALCENAPSAGKAKWRKLSWENSDIFQIPTVNLYFCINIE